MHDSPGVFFRRQLSFVWCIPLVLLGVLGVSLRPASAQATLDESSGKAQLVDGSELSTGDVAPDFRLEGVGGKFVRLSDYRRESAAKAKSEAAGKYVVLTFVRAHW